ncbi:hypothetical protein EV693_10184 [Nicoletella semolina]|uniref:Uncharacterized protein n=1 Tax=Nicoletella semolina TaxID=271160 RepID=A0A4R2NCM4_9PAST|nr:hypothetical protein [Nicoletella semolina]MDH2924282.1 hypothetical protein [Nicoletella semolina]TCP18818.1 hypothetical protein EV693_10184 [Nicoletella semolina]
MVELDKSNLIQQENYQRSSYYIKIELDRIDVKSVTATIKDSKNNTILNYSHNEYDLEHLKSKREFKDLTEPRKRKIEGLLKEANPKKKISLLTTSEQHLKIGEYKFIDNAELIYKATVEMLYNLRNALFHGEIVPNKDTNKVYEAAYRLMRQLVMEL